MGQRQRLWILLLFVLVLLRGVFLSAWLPDWQAPDEPGHYEYARLVAQQGVRVGVENRDEDLQREILIDLNRAGFWAGVRAAQPDPLPQGFADDSFLVRSGPQIGDESPGYYWLLAEAWRLFPGACPADELLRGRVLSSLLLALTVLVAVLAVRIGWPDDRRLGWALPAFVALQPMAAFMGSALNNDSLAMLMGAVAFATAVWFVRRGSTLLRGCLLVAVTAGSVWAKKTDLFLWPMTLCALLISSPNSFFDRKRWKICLPKTRWQIGLVVVGLAALAGWLATPVPQRAAGWIAGGWDGAGSRWWREDNTGLALVDRDSSQRALLEQTIGPERAWLTREGSLHLSAQVRSLGRPTEVSLRLDDGTIASEAVCSATAEWHTCELTAPPASAGPIRVILAIGAKGHTGVKGEVLWREVELVPADDPGDNLLANPQGETPSRRVVPLLLWVERQLRAPRGWAIALTRAEVWSTGALLRYSGYILLALTGFWGNFGWLQAPLPWPLLLWMGILLGLGLAGSALRLATGFQQCRRCVQPEASGLLCWFRSDGVTVLAMNAVALISLQTALPMIGFAWQPQGRYLLPALLPIGIVMIVGLRQILPIQWQDRAERIIMASLVLCNLAMFWVIGQRW